MDRARPRLFRPLRGVDGTPLIGILAPSARRRLARFLPEVAPNLLLQIKRAGNDVVNVVEIPDTERALKEDIRLVGRILGDTIRQQQGEAIFGPSSASGRFRSHSAARAIPAPGANSRFRSTACPTTARSKSCAPSATFHISLTSPKTSTISAACGCRRAMPESGAARHHSQCTGALKAVGVPRPTLQALFDSILVSPVLTAHPTEVRRKSVLDREIDVAHLLADRDRKLLTPLGVNGDRESTFTGDLDALADQPVAAWPPDRGGRSRQRTIRTTDHTFFGNCRASMATSRMASWQMIPPWTNTELPSFIRMGSWIGGDRDGNPFVTAEVLRQAIDMQSERILEFYLDELHLLGAELSLDRARITVSSVQLEELVQPIS